LNPLEHDGETLETQANGFEFMLLAIPEKHDINPFIKLLKLGCTRPVVGALGPLAAVNNMERDLPS
jgi:alcohol dehydrogenase (NADP+)